VYDEFLLKLARLKKTNNEDSNDIVRSSRFRVHRLWSHSFRFQEAIRLLIKASSDKIREAVDAVNEKRGEDRDKVDYIAKRLFQDENAKEVAAVFSCPSTVVVFC